MRNKKTDKNMQFDFICNNKCIMGKFDYYEDSSLIYRVDNGGFSVLLGDNWTLNLIVNYENGYCEGFETLIDALQIMKSKINLPVAQKGILYFRSNEKLNKGSGCHYLPFENKIYYDANKEIMCIGTKEEKGNAVEFADNIIAVVKDKKLLAIYLKLKGINILRN